MKNPTKFGSPKLDSPNSRYEFLKQAFKSVKTIQKINKYSDWQVGHAGQWNPDVSDARIEEALRPAISHRRQNLRRRQQHLRARLIKQRR